MTTYPDPQPITCRGARPGRIWALRHRFGISGEWIIGPAVGWGERE